MPRLLGNLAALAGAAKYPRPEGVTSAMVDAAAMPSLGVVFSLSLEVGPVVEVGSREAILARAASRGERDAFAEIVELHKRTVYGLCARLLRDREEARDAAQESFVRAWSAIATFDATQPFAPWLTRIARNVCLDLLRRRGPGRRLDREPDGPGGDGPALELPAAEVAADTLLARAETRRALEAAVAELPVHYREVVHLFHVEQRSYREIAATLDLPLGTVMTWLHRARGRLRATLAGTDLERTP